MKCIQRLVIRYHFISRMTFYLVEKEDDNGTQTQGIRYGNRLF